MRLPGALFLTLTLVTLTGCGTGMNKQSQEIPDSPSSTGERARQSPEIAGSLETNRDSGSGGGSRIASTGSVASRGIAGDAATISLASISTVQAATEAIDRKIIRNGELTLETESPTEGLRKITAAAESNGGFVVTSEFKQDKVSAGGKPSQTVIVIARVPATRFASALDQIRNAGDRVIQERINGQDVSEEYLDLEARIRTKKALEAQFLEIMKQARKVEDALQVQRELADVRTEIESFEGRRRFLENQAALSTITTTLQLPQPMVVATASGFGASIKRSFGDAIDTTAAILLFMIQALIVMIPIGIFFGLPGWFLWRVLRRRAPVRKPGPIPAE
jgi:uncharacterized protein DUF4349